MLLYFNNSQNQSFDFLVVQRHTLPPARKPTVILPVTTTFACALILMRKKKTILIMDEKLNPKDKILLARDEGEGNKLKVVKGIDKKGNIDAIDPMKAKQSDFLKIDRHADPIENFFRNFFNQAKNPSHTGFYAVTLDMLDKIVHISEEDLQKYRINPKDYMNNQQEQSSKESEKQIQTKKKKKQWTQKTNKETNLSNSTRTAFLKANIRNTALALKM